ncbi:hypothetical protein B841_07475 [Corynebacterium maris DSM 45190]|uniref:Secreted protein n=1 Tax=Corynebacterium maris DSM 45190 TaxID=1224163 RepID=S5TJS8_9CORY|nr:copper chaperone PCu(A)C [Corynebacterium maris]AGS34968.1 hypothetical protein B841_07475 [Corynebacterium maris DSM 45190]
MNIRNIKKSAVAGVASGALLLTACADQGTETGDEAASATAETTSAADGEAVTLTNGVVRAKGTDVEMTAIFGTLTNALDEDVQIVGIDTGLEAGSYEIHEVVDGVMQEKEEPLTIPAGQDHVLEPGGDHFMIMGHVGEILAGDVVPVTIELADGDVIELGEVPVRTMNAGDEDYGEDGTLQGHSGGMGSAEDGAEEND